MPGTHDNAGESRLDRMERQLKENAAGHAWFAEEHQRLLEAQARLTESLSRLIEENRKRRPQEPS
jgi:hypothetical protein